MVWLPDWKWKQQQAGKKGGKGGSKGWGKPSWSSWKPRWGKGSKKGGGLSKDTSKRVWIGGIPEGTSWKALQEHMDSSGAKTTWIEVFKKSAGMGAAAYKTAEDVAVAIAALNGSVLNGATIEVDSWEKQPKEL
mmetsp:Transcript_82678/g.143612  ORF Transcript_82678/g.143612 Transcript_82678/m.143612 type:complete len:134 (+) Transcript_82678:85-486(+)